jgi:hypothetical protein
MFGRAVGGAKASVFFTLALRIAAALDVFILEFSHSLELARRLLSIWRPLGSTPTQRGRQQRFSGPAFAVPF